MAGTLTHITLANRSLDIADLPGDLKLSLAKRICDYRLGAVLVDLPYFEHVLLNGVRVLLKREIRLGVWGTLFHLRSPTGLCRELIRRADDAPGRAMALGALTHLAVDTLFHAEIEQRVMASADGRSDLNTVHKHVEDQMDLHVHYYLLGHSGVGTPYAREMLALGPDPGWVERFSCAVRAIHGNAPDRDRLSQWLKGLALFGTLQYSRRFPWVVADREDNADLQRVSRSLADAAVELGRQYLEIGADDLSRGDARGAVLDGIPDKNLANGQEACPVIQK
jgi:hypothetical protein